MSKFGAKNSWFGYFGLEFENNIVIFEISTLEFVWLQNFAKKQKCLNLEPKMPYLGVFDQKCLIWVFLGKNFKNAIVIFEISTLKLVCLQNFTEKQKCLNLWPKKCGLGIFGLKFENNIVIFEISTLEFIWLQNFVKKKPEFGTKNALFGCFWQKMPYLGIFGQEFKKYHCDIWNQHPQICLFAKFHGKTKMSKFVTKKVWFGDFWAEIWKQYCNIWNQHPQICLIAKFREKTRMLEFGTKNALLGYFWPEIPYFCNFGQRFSKSYCHVWNQHPQIILFAKFQGKTKTPKFVTKNAWFGYFGLGFESNIVIFEINTHAFV